MVEQKFSEEFQEYKFSDCTIWASGTFFIGNEKYSGVMLANYVKDKIDSKSINIQEMNGFFSFCYITDDKIVLGVDHLRTKPIFYKLSHSNILISDLAESILDREKDKKNEIALNEFKATGYVFGNKTLFEGINYTKGGTLLYIDIDTKEIKEDVFFNFQHNRQEYLLDKLQEKYNDVINNIFDRLIAYADGRQVVLPLSAGHDSLLIACLLKNKGYKNVLTFTYGLVGNNEAETSKEVAMNLGFKWHFVEYTEEKWRKEWANNDLLREFTSYSMNLHCLPHIQDYIAVKEMKEKGVLEDNAVFIPGHCTAGVHFPKAVFYKDTHTQKSLVSFIMHYHFVNNIGVVRKNKKYFKTYLGEFSKQNSYTGTSSSFADVVELWQWYEREPKYIVNSVRNYTFFGYDYWMPLWDVEHARFWRDMSFEIAGDRKWFEWYIQGLYSNILGKKHFDFVPAMKYKKEYMFKDSMLANFVKRIIYFFYTKKHPLAFNEIYSKKEYFREVVVKGNHLLSGYADKFLKIILK